MSLLDLFRPRLSLAAIFELDLAGLRERGIRGILLDLDNTLVPYGSPAAPPEVHTWVGRAKEAGFRLALVTNNRRRRTRDLAAALEIPIASGWAKPSPSMFRRAMDLMGTTPAATALVGDQLLTDILGGNRLGLYTILVAPLGGRDFLTTRWINRSVERILLRLLRLPVPRGDAAP